MVRLLDWLVCSGLFDLFLFVLLFVDSCIGLCLFALLFVVVSVCVFVYLSVDQ